MSQFLAGQKQHMEMLTSMLAQAMQQKHTFVKPASAGNKRSTLDLTEKELSDDEHILEYTSRRQVRETLTGQKRQDTKQTPVKNEHRKSIIDNNSSRHQVNTTWEPSLSSNNLYHSHSTASSSNSFEDTTEDKPTSHRTTTIDQDILDTLPEEAMSTSFEEGLSHEHFQEIFLQSQASEVSKLTPKKIVYREQLGQSHLQQRHTTLNDVGHLTNKEDSTSSSNKGNKTDSDQSRPADQCQIGTLNHD